MDKISASKSSQSVPQTRQANAPEGQEMPIEPIQKVNGSNDTLEISIVAQMLSKLKEMPDISEEKIDEIVAKIRSGKLLVPPNLRNATARMIMANFF